MVTNSSKHTSLLQQTQGRAPWGSLNTNRFTVSQAHEIESHNTILYSPSVNQMQTKPTIVREKRLLAIFKKSKSTNAQALQNSKATTVVASQHQHTHTTHSLVYMNTSQE